LTLKFLQKYEKSLRPKLGKDGDALNFVKLGVGRYGVYVKGYKDGRLALVCVHGSRFKDSMMLIVGCLSGQPPTSKAKRQTGAVRQFFTLYTFLRSCPILWLSH